MARKTLKITQLSQDRISHQVLPKCDFLGHKCGRQCDLSSFPCNFSLILSFEMHSTVTSHSCCSSLSLRSNALPGCMACIGRRRSPLVRPTPPCLLVQQSTGTVKPQLRPKVSCAAVKSGGKGFGAPAVKSTTEELPPDQPCPCGSGATYKACCSPFHSGAALPDTAEQLLRSRCGAVATWGRVPVGGSDRPTALHPVLSSDPCLYLSIW